MILQALTEYYERKAATGDIAPLGFEWKGLPFIIVIDEQGEFVQLEDTRIRVKKKMRPKLFLVPKSVKRTGSTAWKTCSLLWDHCGYILGHSKLDRLKDRKMRHDLLLRINPTDISLKKMRVRKLFLRNMESYQINEAISLIRKEPESENRNNLLESLRELMSAVSVSEKQRDTFINSINNLPRNFHDEIGIQAMKSFYERKEYLRVFGHRRWTTCVSLNGVNTTFKLLGEDGLILSCESVRQYQTELASQPEDPNPYRSLCLVSGNEDYITRIHNQTPIFGGQSTGKLVNFQRNVGFDSYGKQHAYNAPIGLTTHLTYTTALNTLIRGTTNKVVLAGSTLLFWSDKDNWLEDDLAGFITLDKDDPGRIISAVKKLLLQNKKPDAGGESRIYLLGLAPNAARVSVYYWYSGLVKDVCRNIKTHFKDMEISGEDNEDLCFSLGELLTHVALQYKLINLPDSIGRELIKAFFEGSTYPKSLLHAVIRRIRANLNITRIRAAIIKACINRFNRLHNAKEDEITVSLDKSSLNPAYLLGRFLAVAERIQYEALKVETICDRYYCTFSSAPVTAFPQLMKLTRHHLAKLGEGKNSLEGLMEEILGRLDGASGVPRQFTLDEQGRFALGYYHQRQILGYAKEIKDEWNYHKQI